MKNSKKIQYQIETDYEIEFYPLSDFTKVDNFSGGKDLFIVSVKNTEIKTGFYESKFSSKSQKIITQAHLNDLVAHPEKEAELDKKHALTKPVWLVKKEFLSHFTEFGMNGVLSQFGGKDSKDSKYNDFIKDAANSAFEFIQLVPNQEGKRVWKDSNNSMYIEPFVLNYIGANLDNGTYHLDEFIEKLMQRDDVAFITESESRHHQSQLLKAPLTGKEKGVENIIDDIPGYNSSDDKTETICLVYYPKQEDIEKILNWKESSKGDKSIWSDDTFIVKNILGGNAYSKIPVPEVEPIVPKRKFKK